MRFISANIHMRIKETDQLIRAVINAEQIVSVLSYDAGNQASIMMVTGDRLIVDIPFKILAENLLEHA